MSSAAKPWCQPFGTPEPKKRLIARKGRWYLIRLGCETLQIWGRNALGERDMLPNFVSALGRGK